MTDAPPAKKQKIHHGNKQNYYKYKTKKHFIMPGQRGFLATCNTREKDCVRECYNVLNQYADELYGPRNTEEESETKDNPVQEEKDVSDELLKNIDDTKTESKEQKFRFQLVDTGSKNCLFIKTTLSDPVELGHKIAKDIVTTKVQKTRYLLRLVPIEDVCKANLKDIIDTAGAIFDKYFLKEGKTFSIIFNRRYNNEVKRDEIINELAELVASKNVKNKVDLKNPELSVIVEVIKGLCCLSVIPEYISLKKYNLVELAAKEPPVKASDETNEPESKEKEEETKEEK